MEEYGFSFVSQNTSFQTSSSWSLNCNFRPSKKATFSFVKFSVLDFWSVNQTHWDVRFSPEIHGICWWNNICYNAMSYFRNRINCKKQNYISFCFPNLTTKQNCNFFFNLEVWSVNGNLIQTGRVWMNHCSWNQCHICH